jgi:peptide-methionine (S)-S-oxide reductase
MNLAPCRNGPVILGMVLILRSFRDQNMAIATFGAGCFWGVEAVFQKLNGVLQTTVGYEGGHLDNPTYEDVCTDTTGHAEVVQIEYDDARLNYDELLEVFWSNHNPTTLNRQGPDTGTQYRSAIFYHTPDQMRTAEQSKAAQNEAGRFKHPIVTTLEPASRFYEAEADHQKYLEKHGLDVCHI